MGGWGGPRTLCALTIAPTLSVWVTLWLSARGFHKSLDTLSP